jgi:hypothetical protein
MNRRQAVIGALSSLVAALGGTRGTQARVAPTSPMLGSNIVAVSVFAGQGSNTNVDTGLTYQGQSVSPTWVGITPTGYQVTGTVGIFPHQADTLIDIQVSDGVPWTGLAVYVL